MQTQLIPIDSIAQDPRNARTHGERNLAAIQAALQRFGQQKPIVVGRQSRIIYAGNGTHRAAKSLGWSEIWVAWSDLSQEEAIAYGIADNRTSELADWDGEMLMELARELDDISLLDAMGFDPGEMDALLHSVTETTDALLTDPAEAAKTESAPAEPPQAESRGGVTITLLMEVPRATWKRFNEIKKRLNTRDNAEALGALLEAYENV